MKPVFIFADHVKRLLESGKKEIEIPAGTRISAAAYDIIRDNKIRIIHIAAEKPAADIRAQEAEDKPAAAEKSAETQESPAAENGRKGTSREEAGKISEDVLEEIIDRVIERFKQAKGLETPTGTAATGAKAETGEDEAQGDDLVICRCEEITRGEIREAIKNGMRTLNGIKRVTRAGMGLCQGQTCQRLVARILTEELNLAAADIDPTTARGPVRPLRLEVFANS
jgi:bacterioferritin-associated ferredoxin